MDIKNSKYFSLVGKDEYKDLVNFLYKYADCEHKETLDTNNSTNRKYVLITKDNLFKAIKVKIRYVLLIHDLYNYKHMCNMCGCISNVFTQDYRGTECIR